MTPDEAKEAAAREALKHVRDGMKLGLGTGSTAAKFVAGLGEMVADGLNVVCVPTSEATRQQAESLNIPLTRLDEEPILDLTVDGADELDANLTLIKGGGGALLREKIVASSSKQMIVIADDTKKVDTLGKFPLPIEIVPFGVKSTAMKIEHASRWAGCEGPLALRIRDEELFVTDNGNVIIDCAFGEIPDAQKLASALSTIPGLVDHGLFIDMAGLAILGGSNGIEIIERKSA
jgi:ribose 5-phosphate isomerase A